MWIFFKIVRWKYLIIIALTMIIMRYFVLFPVLSYFDNNYFFSDIGFVFLCMAVVFISAGGFVINDYFDRKNDIFFRPDNILVAFKIKRRFVIVIHIVLSVLGIISGFIASYYAGSLKYGISFVLISFILWKYSTHLKKTVFWGNFSIAFLIALIPIAVGAAEYFAIKNSFIELQYAKFESIKTANSLLFGFAAFAFIYSFIREIIKNKHNLIKETKAETNFFTHNLEFSISNIFIVILSLFAAVSVFFAYYFYVSKLDFFQNDIFSDFYVWVLIIIPSLFLSFKSLFASKIQHYKYMFKLIYLIMISGVFYSFIIAYMIYG